MGGQVAPAYCTRVSWIMGQRLDCITCHSSRITRHACQVRDAEVNRIRYMDSAGLPSLVRF
jgi:hypothetical protein